MEQYNIEKINIGQNLKFIRKSQNLSQDNVALATGIKQQNLSRWEMGIHIPTIVDCMKLANFYRVSLEELVAY